MDMLEWAKKEIDIAKKRERGNTPEGEWDYGCACYDSAFKAFKSLCEDEHSGMSIIITKSILDRLIDGKTLTPIEDTDDIWDSCDYGINHEYKEYQCTRMSALFKKVYPDGTVIYNDVNRCYGRDIYTGNAYHSRLIDCIIQEIDPITMPYMPKNPIDIATEDFLFNEKNGDYDTIGVYYAIIDEKRIEINRFFAEAHDFPERKETYPGLVEITRDEFEHRRYCTQRKNESASRRNN